MKLLAQLVTPVKVKLLVSKSVGPLLAQPSPDLESQGLHSEEGLVQAGGTDVPLLLRNRSCFTVELPAAWDVGLTTEVDVVSDSPVKIKGPEISANGSQVGQFEATGTTSTRERTDKLLTNYLQAFG